jgi:NAD(P)-dependent dehydrogenase (short-subunit alcohol dehydrogenase family)
MNKAIIITGASRGIGAETAILAAKLGYDICINYHSNITAAENILDQVKNMVPMLLPYKPIYPKKVKL